VGRFGTGPAIAGYRLVEVDHEMSLVEHPNALRMIEGGDEMMGEILEHGDGDVRIDGRRVGWSAAHIADAEGAEELEDLDLAAEVLGHEGRRTPNCMLGCAAKRRILASTTSLERARQTRPLCVVQLGGPSAEIQTMWTLSSTQRATSSPKSPLVWSSTRNPGPSTGVPRGGFPPCG